MELSARYGVKKQKGKAAAYNHFKNFCGDGVFTADGTDWKEKRTAVLHALLRKKTGRMISFAKPKPYTYVGFELNEFLGTDAVASISACFFAGTACSVTLGNTC